MKYRWTIDHERRLVVYTFEGVIHFDEYIRVAQETFNDPNFVHSYNAISDYRKATTTMTPEDIQKFRSFTDKTRNCPGRTAVVITEPWFTTLADLYAFYNTSLREYKLFYIYENAEAWVLGHSLEKA